jgi:hypothetical protein
MENKACGLLQSKHDIKELLAWSMSLGDVTMETKACNLL